MIGASVLPASAHAQASAGGSFASETPKVTALTCATSCTGLDSAGPGSVVRISGEALDQATAVAFLGGPGQQDDRVVPAESPSPGAVSATVPAGAASGPVAVANDDGNVSPASRATLTITTMTAASASGGVEARVDSRKVFYAGRRKARLSYFVRSGGTTTARGEIVKAKTGKVVRAFPAATVPGRTVQTIEWDGLVGGKVPSDGRYLWRVHVQPADGDATATTAQAAETLIEEPFTFVRDRFPIRGKHRYGTGAGAYGASRGGRSHQGRDVFASCGTPLVAARGGVVKFAGFQSRAGNYIVIDPAGTGQDHVYMHLKDEIAFKKGDKVFTGQPIGEVGDTGVADGCHLHFELWSSPGWYSGGRAIDPTPSLKRWDRLS